MAWERAGSALLVHDDFLEIFLTSQQSRQSTGALQSTIKKVH